MKKKLYKIKIAFGLLEELPCEYSEQEDEFVLTVEIEDFLSGVMVERTFKLKQCEIDKPLTIMSKHVCIANENNMALYDGVYYIFTSKKDILFNTLIFLYDNYIRLLKERLEKEKREVLKSIERAEGYLNSFLCEKNRKENE